MNKTLLLILLFNMSSGFAIETLSPEDKKFFQVIFPKIDQVQKIKIKDTISAEGNNDVLLVALSREKRVGFIRSINTSTGCNSACLPIVYSSFYNLKGEYLKLKSRPGLTKIFHAPFTEEDYSRLEFLLAMAPKILNTIKNPKEMTDAISGETMKVYKSSVVEGAAYSTLRIHLYHQESLKHISELLKKTP